MAAIILADACPVCDPGVPDASLPLTAQDANGGTVTSHRCSSCGTAWETWWDRDGWPITRKLAPVTAEQAAQHQADLAAALRRSAA
jgi:hypothetical protein